MIQEMKIAFRNLNRQKKRSFLLAGAIGFGIMIVTLINGFSGAFIENVSENFSHLLAGHIFVEGVEKSDRGRNNYFIQNDQVLIEGIESLDLPLRFLTKRSDFDGNLVYNGQPIRQTIVGADWSQENYFQDRMMLVDGSFANMSDPQGLILSQDITERLGLGIGDRMLVKLKTYTGQQNLGEFVLAAVIADPGLIGSMSGYANLDYVNELLNLGPGEYKILGLYLENMSSIDDSVASLYAALEERDINLFPRDADAEDANYIEALMNQGEEETWEGLRYRLYTLNDILSEVQDLVTVLNVASLIILLVLFIIIMVGITNTFRMVMLERVREIGTIRALGVQQAGVLWMFLYEALFIGLLGFAAGLTLAGLIMAGLHTINWGMDMPIFILLKNGHMTFRLFAWQLFMNLAIVAGLTLFAAYGPARKAAALEPAHALRIQG